MSTEAVTWLRSLIERDKRDAELISSGGFAPEHWDSDPQGQVNLPVLDCSDAITLALGADPEDLEINPSQVRQSWTAVYAWEKENHEAEGERCRESDMPVILADNGRREANHVIRYDPRWAVADCEAKLAILDDHHILARDDRTGAYEEFSVIDIGGANKGFGCVTCHYYAQGAVKGFGYCRTVRHLASAYRYRDGYELHWGAA